MSFIDENRNFINIKLHFEMKGLSYSDRQIKYLLIKEQVQLRLKESYSKSKDKSLFYKETFEVLKDYESEYLFLNLFFENDASEIINYLINNNTFCDFTFKDNISLFDSFIYFIQTKKSFYEKDLIEFIKITFIDIVDNLEEFDWKNENERINGLIVKYSDYIINHFQFGDKLRIIDSFLLFSKIWNHFSEYIYPFNNKKAIILYNSLNHCLDIIEIYEKPFLYIFIQKIESLFSSLFFKLKYIPIIDNSSNESYKTGYIIQRDLFNQKFEYYKNLNSISFNDNYLDLFIKIDQINDDKIYKKIKDIIQKKIESFHFPEIEEINSIIKLELAEKAKDLRKSLFKSFYLFDYIKLKDI